MNDDRDEYHYVSKGTGVYDKAICKYNREHKKLLEDISQSLKTIVQMMMDEKRDRVKLEEKLKEQEKRLTKIEFSPPPQGGPEFQNILKEEKSSGLLS